MKLRTLSDLELLKYKALRLTVLVITSVPIIMESMVAIQTGGFEARTIGVFAINACLMLTILYARAVKVQSGAILFCLVFFVGILKVSYDFGGLSSHVLLTYPTLVILSLLTVNFRFCIALSIALIGAGGIFFVLQTQGHLPANPLQHDPSLTLTNLFITLTTIGGLSYYYKEVITLQARKLEEKNKSLNQMVHVLAHDVRSPMSSITGYSELLLELNAEEPSRQYSERIFTIARNATGMLENILNFHALKENKMALASENFPLAASLNAAIELATPIAERKDIRLLLEGDTDDHVFGDRRMIEQCLMNLLNNAIKFSEAGSTVTLKAESHATEVTLFIIDEGIGIERAHLSSLFIADSGIRNHGTEGETSYGHGLPICNGILRLHGSTLEVESTPGQGSKFYFNLPRGAE